MAKHPDLTAFDARVRREFDALRARITTLALPAGHTWRQPGDELRWFAGSVLDSSRYGASCFAGLTQSDDHDPDQVQIEVRWFWRAEADTPRRFEISHDRCRALILCSKGPRFWLQSRSLLVGNEAFPTADSVAELAERIHETLTRALERDAPASLAA